MAVMGLKYMVVVRIILLAVVRICDNGGTTIWP